MTVIYECLVCARKFAFQKTQKKHILAHVLVGDIPSEEMPEYEIAGIQDGSPNAWRAAGAIVHEGPTKND